MNKGVQLPCNERKHKTGVKSFLAYPDAEYLEKKRTSWFILCSVKHILLLPQFFEVESIPAM